MKKITVISAFLLLFALAGWAQEPQASQEASRPEEVTVPEGTVIPIVLSDYLNTRSSQVGDVFYADTTYPIWVQQRLVIPRGSTIRGTVTEVVRPGKIKGKGRLAVRFDDILLPNGVQREFVATFRGMHGPGNESLDRKNETVAADGSTGEDVGTVVGTTTTGAILGGLLGQSRSGAAIGAGTGAAAGLATVLFSRGRDLVINPGTRFDIELKKPMKFAFNELQFTDGQIKSAPRDVRPNPAQTAPRKPILGGGHIGIGRYPGI
jgi:hypothetical protein